MAEAWHGLRGPADVLIPDDTRELVYSGLGSLAFGSASYVARHYAITHAMAREPAVVARVYAAHPRAIYPRAALRSAVGRTVAKGGIWRAAGLIVAPVPIVGWAITALTIAYSLPGSGDPLGQTMPGDIRYHHLVAD